MSRGDQPPAPADQEQRAWHVIVIQEGRTGQAGQAGPPSAASTTDTSCSELHFSTAGIMAASSTSMDCCHFSAGLLLNFAGLQQFSSQPASQQASQQKIPFPSLEPKRYGADLYLNTVDDEILPRCQGPHLEPCLWLPLPVRQCRCLWFLSPCDFKHLLIWVLSCVIFPPCR